MCGFGAWQIRMAASINYLESRVRQGLGQGPLLSAGLPCGSMFV